jgi:hypothetical protein
MMLCHQRESLPPKYLLAHMMSVPLRKVEGWTYGSQGPGDRATAPRGPVTHRQTDRQIDRQTDRHYVSGTSHIAVHAFIPKSKPSAGAIEHSSTIAATMAHSTARIFCMLDFTGKRLVGRPFPSLFLRHAFHYIRAVGQGFP